MALRGTLKDFGIADIFQLIGHQGKTGILTVRNRDQEVKIHFLNGSVVRADSSTRHKRDLLGAMLVRAEVVTEPQLTASLEIQRKTLKRLGDVLCEAGYLDRKTLAAFAKLQTSETIYRLFLWDAGTYEFTQADITGGEDVEPLRSENVLMEGFRQVDEWPMIRRKISGYGAMFEILEDLDALTHAAAPTATKAEDDLGLDAAFGDLGGEGEGDPRRRNIGQNERIIYHLITPTRDVQKIIDLSRLGEFETCKALVALIDAKIIAASPEGHRKPSAEAMVGGIHPRHRSRWTPALLSVAISLVLLGGTAYAIWTVAFSPQATLNLRPSPLVGFTAVEFQSSLARAQVAKLKQALAVYHAETGEFPAQLDALVDANLIAPRDLRFPWQAPYYYERRGDGYALLRPLY